MAATATACRWCLVRQDGLIHALSATCVHAGGPLAKGTLIDGSLRCPWHGSVFRLTDGKPLRGPATAPAAHLGGARRGRAGAVRSAGT